MGKKPIALRLCETGCSKYISYVGVGIIDSTRTTIICLTSFETKSDRQEYVVMGFIYFFLLCFVTPSVDGVELGAELFLD